MPKHSVCLGFQAKPTVAVSLERSRRIWKARVEIMGELATGPSKWAEQDLQNPLVRRKCEAEEENLSREILNVILPQIIRNQTAMVVGFGPGRRLYEYLRATEGYRYLLGWYLVAFFEKFNFVNS